MRDALQSMPKVVNCLPSLPDKELFQLFENCADKLDGPQEMEARSCLAALGVEWGRRRNRPTCRQEKIGAIETGLLKRLGYCVGSGNAVPAGKRRKRLEAIFLQSELPFWHSPAYTASFGAPSSLQRYIKIRDCLEMFAANAERNDPVRFARAIREWREDLEWFGSAIGSSERVRGST